MRALQHNEIEIKEKINKFDDSIFLNVDSTLQRIRLDSICYVKGYGDYMQFNLDNEVFMVYITMSKLEGYLPEADFLRIHRSYIVRLDKIQKISTRMVTIGMVDIPVSKRKRHQLKTMIPWLF